LGQYRKTAIIVGILFLVCTGATLLSFPFGGSLLENSDYLTKLAGRETSVVTGALIEFIWAASGAGIAIALYPVLRRVNDAVALGSVGLRLAEGIFVLLGTLGMLLFLTMSKEFVSAGAAGLYSFNTSGTLLLGMRDWSQNVLSSLGFALGAMMYYALFYKSQIIPRWLSGWGFLGAVLSLAATIQASYAGTFDLGSVNTILNIPIGVNELVLAVWLIVKGFNAKSIASLYEKVNA